MKSFSKLAIFCGVLSLVTDQLSKIWVLSLGDYVINQGGALGSAQGESWWSGVVAVILFGGSIVLWRKRRSMSRIVQTGWLIILFSGLSNLLDRLYRDGVIDWIRYPIINVVGNLADIYLGLGLIIIIWGMKSDHLEKPEV